MFKSYEEITAEVLQELLGMGLEHWEVEAVAEIGARAARDAAAIGGSARCALMQKALTVALAKTITDIETSAALGARR